MYRNQKLGLKTGMTLCHRWLYPEAFGRKLVSRSADTKVYRTVKSLSEIVSPANTRDKQMKPSDLAS